ncbi:MAG: ATP-grasp domain-containing protein [Pirellulales bacterium]
MSERIAIVGASVRAAAASAVRAGFEVAAADLFADEDLCRIAAATQIENYPFGLVGWLQALSPPPDAWMYTGALENHPGLVDQMAAIAPLWGNGGDVLRTVRSPWRVADVLRQAGLLFPEMRNSPAGLPRDGTWLAKTGRGASGKGVAVLDDFGDRPECFLQQRLPGIPCSAVYVASGGKSKLLGILRQLIGEPWLHAQEFQYCGAIGPWPVSAPALSDIRRIGGVLANYFGVRGLFGVDFILDDDRIWTLEVNPRYPASVEIVERAMGINAIAEHAAACCESTLANDFHPISNTVFGKAILFSLQSITIHEDVRLPSQVARGGGSWPTLADLPRVGTHIEAARPVLTLFVEGATAGEVIANLKVRVANVEQQLYLD